MTSLEQKQVTKLQNQVGPNKYDAVVRLDLFVDVFDWNRGWKMAVYQERLQQLAKCTAVRVAPIGVFNAGKTWLINKLCGGDTQLLSATDEHTEGLSIKLSHLADDNGRLVCFLDTAGLNSPVTSVTALGRMLGHVKMDPMKAMEEMLQELKRHENFIRQVAFEFAHVYLLVVGQISHRDQLEMLQLVQLAEQCGGTKKHVVVVHNLKTMTYDDFCSKDIDVQTKVAYRDSMANVFNLRRSQVEMTVGDSTEWIDQLQLYFGSDNHAVDIRHVFLTKEEYKNGKLVDEKCKNAFVIQYLRNLIKSPVPVTGHILRDIARASTKCALSMARLPSGMPIEIRYHQTRNVLLAGGVPQKEIDELKQWTKEEAAVRAHEAAKEEAQAALAEGETLTEEQIEALRVKAVSSVQHPEYDGETLQPLGEAVVARPVALGAVSATNGDGHAKFNVARKRVLVGEMPMWAVLVHIAVPGLAADQLGRVKAALRWEHGLTMEALTPQAPETLKINFKACVVAMAAKQAAALNKSGTPTVGALGGIIQVNAQQRPIVIEAGNRPFPAEGTAIGAAKEALREDGSFELDVLVHTKVENCVWEVVPVVNYAQGVLSVMVIAEPSDEDLTASANNWSAAQPLADDPTHTLADPNRDVKDLEAEFNEAAC